MKKIAFAILISVFYITPLMAQTGKLQIGVQTGFAIPQDKFGTGFENYNDNGYAATGQNYKICAEYRLQNIFCVGLNYLYFSNGLLEGNIKHTTGNFYTTTKNTTLLNSSSQGLIISGMLKGTETPLFIKGFMGVGVSKTAEFEVTNSFESIRINQASSDLGGILGLGIGFYVPISNKWFIELEADYISSLAKPTNITLTDKITNETYDGIGVTYNQTVININVGVGIFLFND
jgi:hypothetical protein